MPKAIEHGEEIIDRLETNMPLSKFSAGEHLSMQFVMLTEKKTFAHADFTARPDQAFPIVRLGGELARKQNLDAAMQEIAGGGIADADRLCPDTFAAAEEPRRKNASVVEDQQIGGLQQVRKFAEQFV